VEINDQILTSKETRNFAPREWINNMVRLVVYVILTW